MKSALIAIGSLALGASALLYSARMRRAHGSSLPLVYSGPRSSRLSRREARRQNEPAEVEELVGAPAAGTLSGD